ncbi:bifunctional diguanylate cyclase/phosphodiesterase [Maridesulfovibrio frigidus]|uniref:bifunctional diguanylate cyclase/phosphodiesterase n=1 Tax=Maridesulfovibrio frigidus TaxID=340956 RepID=UPI00054FB1EA|nr:EAL domain-containing protein [Maridesulfovibrio frigidus]
MKFYNFLSRFRIKARLIIVFSMLLVFSLILCGSTIYPLVRSVIQDNIEEELANTTTTTINMIKVAVDVSVRNYLRAVAEKNHDIVTSLYNQYERGEITEKDAKETAEKLLSSQPIGRTGYVYCLNSNGRVEVHPSEALKLQDLTSRDIVRRQIAKKTGYLEYEWANPGESKTRPKALYMTYFKPWDWIISASSYREEFDSLIDVDDFRSQIAEIKLGESGYIFIVGKNGQTILHPWVEGNFSNYADVLGYSFMRDIYEQKSGQLYYEWKDLDSDVVRDKIAVFKYFPEMDWIVAASVYADEIYEPLDNIIYLVLISVFLSLLVALPLSAVLGLSITRPVERLVGLFSKAAEGDMAIRSENSAPDEIGILSRKFNAFMDHLDTVEKNLNVEVGIRQESEYQRRLFEEVFNNALEGISITDIKGNIVAANPGFTTITGYEVDEVIGKNPSVLKSDKHDKSFYDQMWSKLALDGHWVGEIWNRRKNGESYPEMLSISAIRNSSGEPTHYVAVFHDITEMKSKEEQLQFQAHHDALTGLPNRALLLDRITIAIAHAKRLETRIALFFIDLDNFKTINDSLGHALGDRLLQRTTTRISNVFREQDTIARLGGDEFVIMVEDVTDERHLINQAKRLLMAFSAPFEIDGNELHVTTSLGITVFPDDGDDPGTLIKNADMAMYQAKGEGKNGYHMFRQEMHDRVERRLQLENALRTAVQKQEFVVYYQPKVDLNSGHVIGLEALVRWIRQDGEVISPLEFIPLAEETGLIVPIGRTVMEHSCMDQHEIRNKGGHDLMISINLSARQFQEENLLQTVKEVVNSCNADPNMLEFEITESVLMNDIDKTVDTLNNITAMGFSLSIDDFGTGYSSLAYLKTFPLTTLKVDRSFVMDITHDKDDAQIVQTVVNMSHNLGLDVVAEGVETEEQAEMLRKFGCAKGQGYLFGKPMPLLELIAFLKARL